MNAAITDKDDNAPEVPEAPQVVDADGHVLEPIEAWEDVPQRHRPRIEVDAQGLEHVIVGDTEILGVSLGLLGTPGARMSDLHAPRRLEEAQPGGFDPDQRLADMDIEGIDAAVLYPSIGLYFWGLDDSEAAIANARAYNDWLASYCEADPDRLHGAAMLPMQDPPAAAAELRRVHFELGFPACFVRPNPCQGRVLADPAHEVVWATAEELGVTVGIHEGSSYTIPTLGHDRQLDPLVLHAVSHAFEEMLACAQLITTGVMARHPDLRFAFLESHGGWAPFWLERLDEQVFGFGAYCPELELAPSEYFARQCWISFEIDEPTLPALAPFIGEERIIWGSDYPHHDCTFPGAVKELRQVISPMTADAQASVLGGNARELYRLG